MTDSNAIGVRFSKEILEKIDTLSEAEKSDRSTVIRQLVEKGFEEKIKEKAAQDYVAGNLSFSKAAKNSGLTIWDFQQFLVSKGFKSEYSIYDLENEIKQLNTKKK